MDEEHLCLSWGKRFRTAFNDLGFNRDRIPANVPLILTTATLAAGRDTDEILRLFSLEPGGYHLIRHSNIRPDIELLFRVLEAAYDFLTLIMH